MSRCYCLMIAYAVRQQMFQKVYFSVRSCPSTDIKNSNSLYPWKANFAEGETTEVTCSVNYMIGWATDTTMTTGVLVCEGGVWKQQGDSDYSGVAGCVGKLEIQETDVTDGYRDRHT